MDRIIAEYGFYIGWSYGMAAFLMLLEPVILNSQRKSLLQRLRRLARVNSADQ